MTVPGDPDGVVERQGDDPRAQRMAQARRRTEVQRCGQPALGFVEVVLGDPRDGEAAPLGALDPPAAVALARGHAADRRGRSRAEVIATPHCARVRPASAPSINERYARGALRAAIASVADHPLQPVVRGVGCW